MVEVVAALIWREDRFLACQRPAHKARGLLWEFVGGKVEPGETHVEALIRECREELAVTVSVGSVFMEVTHPYPDMTVHLSLFNATIVDGEPQRLEHNALAWITTKEIDSMDFCPADVDILEKLKDVRNYLDANLVACADQGYKVFQGRLIPNYDSQRILGVRMPVLRRLHKELDAVVNTSSFLNALPHKYYEEDNLHALHINSIKDYNHAVAALEQFLPYVNNWATCDMLLPKAFQCCPDGLVEQVAKWLESPKEYTRRFAICILLKLYLKDNFDTSHFQLVLSAKRDEYYVKMAVAWYFASALTFQYEAAIGVLEKSLLDPWTHNKTIQKAIESYRVPKEYKEYLKALKISMKEGKCHD